MAGAAEDRMEVLHFVELPEIGVEVCEGLVGSFGEIVWHNQNRPLQLFPVHHHTNTLPSVLSVTVHRNAQKNRVSLLGYLALPPG